MIWTLPPNLSEGVEIKQGYFDTESEMRIRKYGEEHFITFKGDGGLERLECERSIPSWVFNSHWESTTQFHINKTRYKKPYGKYTLEIDVFKGYDEGPYFMEIEFNSSEEASKFSLPDEEWAIGAVDVTTDKRYKNRYIAEHGLST